MNWQQTFDNTGRIEEKSFTPIPTGKYKATITGCELDLTIEGKEKLKWEFTIIDGDFSNRKCWANQMLNEKGIPYIKQNFFLLEIMIDKASDLEQKVNDVIGMDVEIFIKQKPNKDDVDKPYVNPYINRKLDKDEVSKLTDGPLFDDNEKILF